MSYRSLSLTPLASALLIALSSADTIHTTEGSTIEDCTVLEETLLEVTYRRDGGNKTSMPSSDVLRIDFTTMPTLVDRAETAVADDQLFDAVDKKNHDGSISSGELQTLERTYLDGDKATRGSQSKCGGAGPGLVCESSPCTTKPSTPPKPLVASNWTSRLRRCSRNAVYVSRRSASSSSPRTRL